MCEASKVLQVLDYEKALFLRGRITFPFFAMPLKLYLKDDVIMDSDSLYISLYYM